MPEKPRIPSPAKAAVATHRPRDKNGHFIKSSLLNITENTSANDETLVDVKVTNPLRRIAAILQQIKNKQSTVVDFKFTIPLVALPLFMLLAFSLGKSGGVTCGGNTQTRIGLFYTLRATGNNQAGIFDRTKQALATNIPFLAPVLANASGQKTSANRQILIQQGNSVLTVENPNNIDLSAYHTRQIFVTGRVNTCENTIEVDNDSSVQLLP
ncbi:MAG: hypothetical protein Q8Q49_05750 [bacterium]|nr:hypothetical protein [bacterium]